MKNNIILVSIIFFSILCFKNTTAFAFSVLKTDEGDTYFFRVCDSQYICEYKCIEKDGSNLKNTSILTNQNVRLFCSQYQNSNTTSGLSIMKDPNVLLPLLVKVNILEIVTSDQKEKYKALTNFIEPNGLFSALSDKHKYINSCLSCEYSTEEFVLNTWKKIKEGSDMIYQLYSPKKIASRQWSKPLGKMSFEDAKKACENYNFRVNNEKWSLPSSSDLKEAIKYGLGEEFNDTVEGLEKLSTNDFAWTENKSKQQLIVPWNSEAHTTDSTENYVICSREYNRE